ncbi:MAG TPA: hypothetical protein VH268_07410 [Solirubrobacterales bacterium]|jgi:hypothetical protein|nr:hypothetical protein [Solirubrobacterales bacterium]
MRLLADGRVDISFGDHDLVTRSIGKKGFAGAIAGAPSGKIVAAGRSRAGVRTTESIRQRIRTPAVALGGDKLLVARGRHIRSGRH